MQEQVLGEARGGRSIIFLTSYDLTGLRNMLTSEGRGQWNVICTVVMSLMQGSQAGQLVLVPIFTVLLSSELDVAAGSPPSLAANAEDRNTRATGTSFNYDLNWDNNWV